MSGKKQDFTQVAFRVAQQATRQAPAEEPKPVPTKAAALAHRIDVIKSRGGINAREVAQLLDTTPETVSRWNTGKVEPHPDRLQRLLTLEWLLEELSDLYTPEEARLWLFSPNRLLGGKRPADRIQEGCLDDVLAVIAQLREGAYV